MRGGRGRGGRGGPRSPNQSPNGSPGNRGGFVGPMRGAGGRNSIGPVPGMPGGRGVPSPRPMGGRGAAGPMPGMRGAPVRGRGMESPTRGTNTPHIGGYNPNTHGLHSFQEPTPPKRWTSGDFSGLSMTNSTDSSDCEAKADTISVGNQEGVKRVTLELMNAHQSFITELQAVIDVRTLVRIYLSFCL